MDYIKETFAFMLVVFIIFTLDGCQNTSRLSKVYRQPPTFSAICHPGAIGNKCRLAAVRSVAND